MRRRGVYVLFLRFDEDTETEAGALGHICLPAGDYCYVGSAMGGLDQRLSRHLRREKTLRWHIDYLTSVCDSSEAYESYPDFIPECDLARMISECGGVPELKGFGCSDCRCATHLFRADEEVLQNVAARCRLAPFRARELL